jgi:hypothetical protein
VGAGVVFDFDIRNEEIAQLLMRIANPATSVPLI